MYFRRDIRRNVVNKITFQIYEQIEAEKTRNLDIKAKTFAYTKMCASLSALRRMLFRASWPRNRSQFPQWRYYAD